MNPIDEFNDFLRENGVNIKTIIADGKLHRAHNDGDKSGTLNIAYKLHLDGVPAGYVENFKTGLKANWHSQSAPTTPNPDHQRHIEQAKAQRQKDEATRQQRAAAIARNTWQKTPLATPSNVYLQKKGIQAHGTHQHYSGALIVPLFNAANALINLQFIQPDSKRFLKGGRKAGCFWWIGNHTDTVLIAEGFATAASLHQATGLLTVIAFDAGNLASVAKIVRKRQPNAKIVLCADNDESGIGQDKAAQAALAVDGLVAMPPITGDFNDYAALMIGGAYE